MSKVKIEKINVSDRIVHDNLIKTFIMVFCSRDKMNFGLLLHEDGLFFDRMNKTVAEAHLFSIIFNDIEIGGLYNIEVRNGVSIDHLPGESVLEFHCSEFKRLKTEEDEGEEYKELMNSKNHKEKIFLFSFSFQDGLIYSIRAPKVWTDKVEKFTLLN
jgi:hypothetical protein